MLVGVSDFSKVLLIALILFFQILVVVRDEAVDLNRDLLLSARSLGAGRLALYLFIYVPGTLPAMLTSLRLSVGTAIAVLFIAEQSLTNWGLGYYIIVRTYQVLRYTEMYAVSSQSVSSDWRSTASLPFSSGRCAPKRTDTPGCPPSEHVRKPRPGGLESIACSDGRALQLPVRHDSQEGCDMSAKKSETTRQKDHAAASAADEAKKEAKQAKQAKQEAADASGDKPTADEIEQIIRQHVGFSMIAGAVPAPVIDVIAITAIQMDMLRQLADKYHVDFNEERGKSIATSLMGATVGTLLGRIGASAVKAIPGIGTLLGIGSQVILAGASTYAIGKVFQGHFEQNGTMFDFDLEKMGKRFRELFEKGKDVAGTMKGHQSKDEIMATISKLKELKDAGSITEEEFEKTKRELLDKLTT